MIRTRYWILLVVLAVLLIVPVLITKNASAATADLTFTVKNVNGNTVQSATVDRYDSSWSYIDAKTTDANGQVKWTGITIATYNFETYYNSEFWGDVQRTLSSGSNSYTFTRFEPHQTSISVMDTNNNAKTKFNDGDTVRTKIVVKNDAASALSSKVEFIWDKDKAVAYDFDQTTGYNANAAGSSGTYSKDYTLPSGNAGSTFYFAYKVYTSINSKDVLTDSWVWSTTSISVMKGDLNFYVKNVNGNLLSGATVKRYDSAWNYIDSKNTDANGKAAWSGLATLKYNFESYNGNEFWGDVAVTISEGSNSYTFTRFEPYQSAITVSDTNGNVKSKFNDGDTVRTKITVKNGASGQLKSKVEMIWDKDKSSPYDFDKTVDYSAIAGGSTGSYSLDFTLPSNNPGATFTLAYYVYTYINSKDVLTDSYVWSGTTLSVMKGDLDFYVKNVNGNLLNGASVKRYDTSWNIIDTKTTDANGKASWSGISTLTYNFESYNGEEFWGDTQVQINEGSNSKTFTRFEPYQTTITISDTSGNVKSKFTDGDIVRTTIKVKNGSNFAQSSKVQFLWDRDKSNPYDFDKTTDYSSNNGGATGTYTMDYTLPSGYGGSTFTLAYKIYTSINNKDVLTDSYVWSTTTFSVMQGDLNFVVKNVNGNLINGATVKRYDASWNPLDTQTTDANGKAVWSGLPTLKYNFETYNGNEFWGDVQISLTEGANTYTFTRFEPYQTSITVTDDSGVAKSKFTDGDTVRTTIKVKNGSNWAQNSKVELFWDRDKSAPYDLDQTTVYSSIDGGSTGSYVTDYSLPSGFGGSTMTLAYKVFTSINNKDVLTDSYVWSTTTITITKSDLEFTVHNSNGNAVAGSSVKRYDSSWKYLDSMTTDSDGKASWSSLPTLSYNFETYNGDEFWGDVSIKLNEGSNSYSFTRFEPYQTSIKFTDKNGKEKDKFDAGETVHATLSLKNGASSSMSSKVEFFWDRDCSSPYDFDFATSYISNNGGTPNNDGYYSDYSIPKDFGGSTLTFGYKIFSQINNKDVLTDSGFWSSKTIVVVTPSDPEVTVSINADVTSGNSPLTVTFTAKAQTGTPEFTYSWDFGDGKSGSGESLTHVYTATSYTEFFATCKVTDARQKVGTSNTLKIVVQVAAGINIQINANPTIGDAPLTVDFKAAVSEGTAPFRISWDLGDGTQATGKEVTHQYDPPSTRTYRIMATVTDSKGSSADSAPIDIRVMKEIELNLNISADPDSGYAPLQVQFNSDLSGGRLPYQYLWDFGDKGSSTEKSPKHIYQNVGVYTATVSISDALSNTQTKSMVITVIKNENELTAFLNADKNEGIAPVLVKFQGSASGGTLPYMYKLTFGDGGNIDTPVFDHVYTIPGQYIAILTVKDAKDQQSSAELTINVQQDPNQTIKVDSIMTHYRNFFIEGVPLENVFTIKYVGGMNSITQVWFNTSEKSVKGTNNGNSLWNGKFDVSLFTPNDVLTITASTNDGKDISYRYSLRVVPLPDWLQTFLKLGTFKVKTTTIYSYDNEYEASFDISIPDPPIDVGFKVPDFVPMVGGDYKFQFSSEFGATLSSTGDATLFGSGTFDVSIADNEGSFTLTVTGLWNIDSGGITWNYAMIELSGELSIPIPGLKHDYTLNVLGFDIAEAELTVDIVPSAHLQFIVDQSDTGLEIIPNSGIRITDILGVFRLGLEAEAELKVADKVVGSVTVGGGAFVTLTPSPAWIKNFGVDAFLTVSSDVLGIEFTLEGTWSYPSGRSADNNDVVWTIAQNSGLGNPKVIGSGGDFINISMPTVELPAKMKDPSVRIDQPINGANVTGTVQLRGIASGNLSSGSIVEINIDGYVWHEVNGVANWSLLVDTRYYSNGIHTIDARVRNGQLCSKIAEIQITVYNPTKPITPVKPGPKTIDTTNGNPRLMTYGIILTAVIILIVIALIWRRARR